MRPPNADACANNDPDPLAPSPLQAAELAMAAIAMVHPLAAEAIAVLATSHEGALGARVAPDATECTAAARGCK
jgi:hypothetical protein